MKYFIPIIILSIFILGCSKDDESSTANSEVEGTWTTSCFLSSGFYRINTITVTGTDVVAKYEWHSDSNCSTDYALYEDTYDSLSIGDEVTFVNGTKGHYFTVDVVSFKLTPQSASAVSTHYVTKTYRGALRAPISF